MNELLILVTGSTCIVKNSHFQSLSAFLNYIWSCYFMNDIWGVYSNYRF